MKFKKALTEESYELGPTADNYGATGVESNGSFVPIAQYKGSIDSTSRSKILSWAKKKNPGVLDKNADGYPDVFVGAGDILKNAKVQPLDGQGIFFKIASSEGVSAVSSKELYFYCQKPVKAGSLSYAPGNVYQIL